MGNRVPLDERETKLLVDALEDAWLNYELTAKDGKELHDLIDKIRGAAKTKKVEVKDP